MAITINDMNTMTPLTDYTTNVLIFRSTKAKDIPGKLDAVANDIKTHFNTVMGEATTYINETTVPHINTAMATVEADHNTFITNISNQQGSYETTITNQQNTFEADRISTETTFTNSITSQQSVFENTLQDQQDNYETDTTINLGNYTGSGAAYTVSQSNSFVFSGPSSVTYAQDGETVVGYTEGPVTVSNIIYDNRDNLIELTETILVDSIPYTKTFTANYDNKGNFISTVEKL